MFTICIKESSYYACPLTTMYTLTACVGNGYSISIRISIRNNILIRIIIIDNTLLTVNIINYCILLNTFIIIITFIYEN